MSISTRNTLLQEFGAVCRRADETDPGTSWFGVVRRDPGQATGGDAQRLAPSLSAITALAGAYADRVYVFPAVIDIRPSTRSFPKPTEKRSPFPST